MATNGRSPIRIKERDMALSTLIDLFIATKQVEGRSQKTLKWYRVFLVEFDRFLANGEPAGLEALTLSNARAFVAHLQGKSAKYGGASMRPQEKGGLSPRTIHGYVRTLKVFGSWLHEEGFTEAHPFERLKAPKLPQTMIEVFSDEEIGRIFEAIQPRTIQGARMYAMVLLLLDTGMRASELCALTLDNTHLNEGYVKVFGKGAKERIVPFGALTRKSLLRYIHSYRPEPASNEMDQVFLSVNATPLSYDGLAQALKRLGKAADVPRLHAHLFRHTFAVRYLMNGGDLMTLKLILGHTTLDVTQMYLHLAESHVQVQHSRFSPVDRLEAATRRSRKGL